MFFIVSQFSWDSQQARERATSGRNKKILNESILFLWWKSDIIKFEFKTKYLGSLCHCARENSLNFFYYISMNPITHLIFFLFLEFCDTRVIERQYLSSHVCDWCWLRVNNLSHLSSIKSTYWPERIVKRGRVAKKLCYDFLSFSAPPAFLMFNQSQYSAGLRV